ncbi:MAG: RNA polymerase sigma factor [Anaerolineales bacterium]|jgi:RNA polymerase sigma-70 factor (ECF subfamily)
MDHHWIELCKAGESSATEKLIQEYQKDVYRLALSILEDPDEAEEGAQEAFIAALRGLDSFHADSSLKTWIFSITINICRTRLRRRRARERLKQIMNGLFYLQNKDNHPPEETVLQNEADARMQRAIRELGEKLRLPIILRYYHDLSTAEIAETLDIPQGTVHSRLNTARERLRRYLKEGPE